MTSPATSSISKIVYLLFSIVFFTLFAVSSYIGVSLYFGTTEPSAVVDTTGKTQGLTDIVHMFSVLILFFSGFSFILTIVFTALFVRKEKRSKIEKKL